LIITEDLSEILGMFAADGNLQDNHISIWGNIHEDKRYYDDTVCPLFSRVFNKIITAHEKKSNSVYGFYICDKKIIQIFKEFGFTRRKTYNVKIPQDILLSKDEKIISAFIRGFTDCDGCLNFVKRYENGYSEFKRKYHTYPRIYIKIVSKNMIDDLSYLLKRLGINHTKSTYKSKQENAKDSWIITIRGKEGLKDWMNKIGFNNYSKNTKYLIWKKYGFCPTPSNISQRELILKEEVNPEILYQDNKN
jgi:intein/homing endonuclease